MEKEILLLATQGNRGRKIRGGCRSIKRLAWAWKSGERTREEFVGVFNREGVLADLQV